MDERSFDEQLPAVHIKDAFDVDRTHPVHAEHADLSALPRRSNGDALPSLSNGGKPARRPGIVWVRASDLLNTGTGRIAGRGLDFEAELARRMRRAPATTRRAIRERTAQLPPLSEFGQPNAHASVARYGLGRREP